MKEEGTAIDYYWELVLRDETTVLIPPESVAKVNKHLTERTPIVTRTATIMPSDVKTFRITNKAANQVPLLDGAAQAFNSAEYNEDGSIVARWVKKNVTQREYSAYYSKLPGYHRLDDDGTQVWIAFFIPIQDINPEKQYYCSEEESAQLDKQRNPHPES